MLERLGTVIYAIGIMCGLAWAVFVVSLIVGNWSNIQNPPLNEVLISIAATLVPALLMAAAGWAIRYILTGRT